MYDLSGGDYFLWYRAVHVLQVFVLLLLFVRLLDARTAEAAAASAVALGGLVGGQTFAWTVREAFPINTSLTVVLCCTAAANLAFAKHRWWTDALAVILFLVAALMLESGLLVMVVFVAGYLVGLPGVSRKGIVALRTLTDFPLRCFLFGLANSSSSLPRDGHPGDR